MTAPDPAEVFRALHATGTFVLPNPWDVGSAVLLHDMGFRALATTSSGLSFSRGRPDAIGALSLDVVLEHLRAIVGATPLPVSADFQHGYAREPEHVARNVARCLETGVAGLSVEDATGDPRAPLFDRALAVERVRAACAVRDEVAPHAVLTARCEAWLVGDPDAERTALDRLSAFAEAGADCLFAPGVREPGAIARLVEAVRPLPLNVLVSAPSPELTVAKLAALGVRRVSVGSALARVAWGAFLRSARAIAATGSFESLAGAAPFAELDGIFGARAPEPSR